MDCSPPGSSAHGDSPGKSTGESLPCPPPGDLPNPGLNLHLLHWQGVFFTIWATREAPYNLQLYPNKRRFNSQNRQIKLPKHSFGLPWWLGGKEFACQWRKQGFDPCVRKIPWRRKWQPTPVFLPGKSHGQKSLVGYTVHRVAKESDMT